MIRIESGLRKRAYPRMPEYRFVFPFCCRPTVADIVTDALRSETAAYWSAICLEISSASSGFDALARATGRAGSAAAGGLRAHDRALRSMHSAPATRRDGRTIERL
jgi:hypothetical protein